MNKTEVQKRILKNGKPLALDKFTWCGDTRTLAIKADKVVVDFTGVHYATIEAGSDSTIEAGSESNITAGALSTIKAGWASNIKAGCGSNITADERCTIEGGKRSTITAGWDSTIKNCAKNTVIVRFDIFEVIQPKEGDTIQTCPQGIKGHLVNGGVK